jgi:TatD DNase family protein
MPLIDAHCHLEDLPQIDEIVERAKNSGLVKMITCSIHPNQWDISKNLAEKFNSIEFANGIHPWYIQPEYFSLIEKLYEAKTNGAVAIGEIGLDFKTAPISCDVQLKFFEAQLEIARNIELPVILHCRGAFTETLLSIKRLGGLPAGGIIHSFSGSAEIAENFIKIGFSFSLGGILTYRNSTKRIKLMQKIYPHNFLLETDSPDIMPVELRNSSKINEPANIVYNLKAAADLLEKPEAEIEEVTFKNAVRMFKLT